MPTSSMNVTSTPVDMIAGLSLMTGTGYQVQVVGKYGVYVSEGATAPDNRNLGHSHHPFESFLVIAGAEPIWIWSNEGVGSVIVATNTS